MAYTVKPFVELMNLSKEALDETLAPVRARAAKARAETLLAETQEKLIELERKISEACARKDIDFINVVDMIDEYELLERRTKQIEKLVGDLFPSRARASRG